MLLAWIPIATSIYTASEIRPGVALSHRLEVGEPFANLTTTVTWAEPDSRGRVAARMEASIVLRPGEDVLVQASLVAEGWAV